MFGRSQGVLAATLGLAAWGACATPEELSDLRPAGDPEVLTVLVADKGPDPDNDGLVGSGQADVTETATFCKTGDNKRPNFVNYPLALGGTQLCPDDLSMGVAEVTDAEPLEWYVRIMFDELLNPDIEELIPILDDNGIETGTFSGTLANTQPVTLTCNGTAVPYDGFYGPEGNTLTWPVGPSLFIQPLDSSGIATGSSCEVSIKDIVKDKDGNSVPATSAETESTFSRSLLSASSARRRRSRTTRRLPIHSRSMRRFRLPSTRLLMARPRCPPPRSSSRPRTTAMAPTPSPPSRPLPQTPTTRR